MGSFYDIANCNWQVKLRYIVIYLSTALKRKITYLVIKLVDGDFYISYKASDV